MEVWGVVNNKDQRPATPQKVGTCQLARKMEHISKEDLKIYNYLNVARKNAKLNLVASSLSGLSSLTAYSVSAKSSGQRYVEERKKRKLPERQFELSSNLSTRKFWAHANFEHTQTLKIRKF